MKEYKVGNYEVELKAAGTIQKRGKEKPLITNSYNFAKRLAEKYNLNVIEVTQ